MPKKHVILFVTVISLLFTSCVSKKKFLEMQTGRVKAEESVRRLTDENNKRTQQIEALIADFETMKNELMESSAIKDQYIDSLNKEVFILDEKMKHQSESLQETSFTLDFEKQRLTNAIESKDKTIESLESEINRLENEIQSKSSAIDQKNFDMNVLNEKVALLETEKKSGETKLAGLTADLEKVKAETTKLQVLIKDKDATIQRLENNVKLLKGELGK